MIHARLGCGEPGSLNRFPPRNLLINGVVYVSGRTFSVSGGETMEGESEGDKMERQEKEGRGDPIEKESDKNAMRPST